MKARELRQLTLDELKNKLAEAKKTLFNLRFQHSIGQLDNYARLTETRRDIARILTVIREKELEASNGGRKKS